MNSDEAQAIVIGGGVAGVSCALECFDVRVDCLLLEARSELGGQLHEVPNSIRNLATGRFDDGAGLRRSLESAAEILGERRRLGAPVERADLAAGWIEAGGWRLSARAFVIATGRRRRTLPAFAEGALGGDVTYQFEPRREHFLGRDAAVVGGGDSAVLDALELAAGGARVHLLHRSPLAARPDVVQALRNEPRIEDLEGWEPESLLGDGRLAGVVAVRRGSGERRELRVGALVLKLGYAPNTEPFAGQIALERGAVVVDADLRASLPHVFAAGDVIAGSYPRIAAALGQGSLAARSVLRLLSERHVSR